MRTGRAAVLAGLIVALACAGGEDSTRPSGSNGVVSVDWVTVPDPLGAPNASVYVVLENTSAAAETLIGVSSPSAETGSLHRMEMSGGMSNMSPMDELELAPGTVVRLEPGGMHGMLEGVSDLAVGTTIEVVFEFAGSPDIRVDVPITPRN